VLAHRDSRQQIDMSLDSDTLSLVGFL
jgi:hypothetical protein